MGSSFEFVSLGATYFFGRALLHSESKRHERFLALGYYIGLSTPANICAGLANWFFFTDSVRMRGQLYSDRHNNSKVSRVQ